MKKLALFICCSIFLFNCEEVVEIDVPTGTPKLVIEALFEVYFEEIPVSTNTIVKLRLSAGYFDEELPVVTNAIVTLEDLSTNSIISFEDVDFDGNYIPTNAFIPCCLDQKIVTNRLKSLLFLDLKNHLYRPQNRVHYFSIVYNDILVLDAISLVEFQQRYPCAHFIIRFKHLLCYKMEVFYYKNVSWSLF